MPFDLMIGVNRAVYPTGVYQGMDLYDSRVSLIQYRELFNAFPEGDVPDFGAGERHEPRTGQLHLDLSKRRCATGTGGTRTRRRTLSTTAAARLEAVPATKQIGYYSDMYKLEFALAEVRDVQTDSGQNPGRKNISKTPRLERRTCYHVGSRCINDKHRTRVFFKT